MQKRSMQKSDANWQSSFLSQFGAVFKIEIQHESDPYFLHENESNQHYISYYLRSPCGVFPRGPFFLRPMVQVRVRFWDDAQNDEQFQKIQKQGIHINDGCFQAFQTGKLRYTLDRILEKKISFKRKVERYLSTFSFFI